MDLQSFSPDYSFIKVEEIDSQTSSPNTPLETLFEGYQYENSSNSSTSSNTSSPKFSNMVQEKPLASEKPGSATKINGPKAKKSYQCSYCQKVFSRPSALQTHIYTHTFEKPFQCLSPNCGRSFSVVSNLRRHFKVHQKIPNGNKLSSEDRLRCVKQLMKRSNDILSKRNIQIQEPTIPFNSNNNQQQQSTNYKYQHYLILPAINNHTNNIACQQNYEPTMMPSIFQLLTTKSQHNNMVPNHTLNDFPLSWSNQFGNSSSIDPSNLALIKEAPIVQSHIISSNDNNQSLSYVSDSNYYDRF